MQNGIPVIEINEKYFYIEYSKSLRTNSDFGILPLATGITLEDAKSLVESMEREGK